MPGNLTQVGLHGLFDGGLGLWLLGQNDLADDRIDIPAEYQEVTDKVLVSEGQLEWRPILCETNTSPDLIRRLQSALRDAGFNPGKIDGKYGRDTQSAMTMYQKDNGLASGQLTMETLRRLKVI